jgi:hypothetical protein
MFLALNRSDWTLARTLGRGFLYQETSHMAALLCFSYALHPSNLPNMRQWSNAQLSDILSDIHAFCALLRHHAENIDLRDKGVQQLFNFHPASAENTYTVPRGSWLHATLNEFVSSSEDNATSNSDLLIASTILRIRLRNSILKFVTAIVDHENNECHSAIAFTPCVRFILTDGCRFGEGCFNHHIPVSDLTHQWLVTQIRIHLQQVILCQMMESIPKQLGGGYGSRK